MGGSADGHALCHRFTHADQPEEALGKDIAQSFKTLVGGELKSYNEMMNDARALATKRMVAEAEALGADAVVNIRYASAAVMQGAAEVIVYGTAVKFVNK
jgi:uncharacterized protein YbjQ (UPF0145 family)